LNSYSAIWFTQFHKAPIVNGFNLF
jgi:hypothetical protein